MNKLYIATLFLIIGVINIAIIIHNTSTYNQYLSSPTHARHLFKQYYYKYTYDKPCFPTTQCYEWVPNVFTEEKYVKYWMSSPQEPTRECVWEDWKTANIPNCEIYDNQFNNLKFLITITVILNSLYLCIMVISIKCSIQIFGYIIASLSVNNIFSITLNTSIQHIYSPWHIFAMFIMCIAAWVIGLPIILYIEKNNTYRRLFLRIENDQLPEELQQNNNDNNDNNDTNHNNINNILIEMIRITEPINRVNNQHFNNDVVVHYNNPENEYHDD